MQPRYRAALKDDKTAISQELVDAIHAAGGRFLKLNDDDNNNSSSRNNKASRWYEVDNTTARKKASQTLREVNTPEFRAAKRAKYNSSKK